jgi:hypothetical protein
MKNIIIAMVISSVALVGCTAQSSPAPTVTITEQAPAPQPNLDDGVVTNSQSFVSFVRQNGGMYGEIANESDIISLGRTICDGLSGGLSEDQITYILAEALVNNNMGNQAGAKFAAALIVGAKNYLCGATY